MKLNDCNINDLIIRSNTKFNFKKWVIQNLITFGISVALAPAIACIMNGFSNISFSIIGTCILAKAGAELGAWGIITYKANRKLQKLVNLLRQDGIKISHLSLKKAKLGTKAPERVMTESSVFNVTEDVTVFKDNLGDLKALRQVRSKLVREFQIPQEDTAILVDYTEIIEDSKEAEKILLKLRRR